MLARRLRIRRLLVIGRRMQRAVSALFPPAPPYDRPIRHPGIPPKELVIAVLILAVIVTLFRECH